MREPSDVRVNEFRTNKVCRSLSPPTSSFVSTDDATSIKAVIFDDTFGLRRNGTDESQNVRFCMSSAAFSRRFLFCRRPGLFITGVVRSALPVSFSVVRT